MAFMVLDCPIRLSCTVGFLMEFRPCLLTSTFLPLAITTLRVLTRALQGVGGRGGAGRRAAGEKE